MLMKLDLRKASRTQAVLIYRSRPRTESDDGIVRSSSRMPILHIRRTADACGEFSDMSSTRRSASARDRAAPHEFARTVRRCIMGALMGMTAKVSRFISQAALWVLASVFDGYSADAKTCRPYEPLCNGSIGSSQGSPENGVTARAL
jgi:hypothetical protein